MKTLIPKIRCMWFAWSSTSLHVLVPKQRGEGWLKCPVGHHSQKWVRLIEQDLGCDMWGLDGAIEFPIGSRVATYVKSRREFESRALPMLALHFRCTEWKDVGLTKLCDEIISTYPTRVTNLLLSK